jgi:hypothetical protein
MRVWETVVVPTRGQNQRRAVVELAAAADPGAVGVG